VFIFNFIAQKQQYIVSTSSSSSQRGGSKPAAPVILVLNSQFLLKKIKSLQKGLRAICSSYQILDQVIPHLMRQFRY